MQHSRLPTVIPRERRQDYPFRQLDVFEVFLKISIQNYLILTNLI